jgi:hypothetical protein
MGQAMPYIGWSITIRESALSVESIQRGEFHMKPIEFQKRWKSGDDLWVIKDAANFLSEVTDKSFSHYFHELHGIYYRENEKLKSEGHKTLHGNNRAFPTSFLKQLYPEAFNPVSDEVTTVQQHATITPIQKLKVLADLYSNDGGGDLTAERFATMACRYITEI